MLQLIWDWLCNVEWHRVLPELVGKGLGFLAGFAASWFLLFRRKLRDLQRLQIGDTDDGTTVPVGCGILGMKTG